MGLDRAKIKERFDTLIGEKLNTALFGWDVILITPDMAGTMKQYSLKALISRFEDKALVNQTTYNTESRIIKIMIKDIELLRTGGAQIAQSLKKVKSTIRVDGITMSIIDEALEANKRILVLKCNRMA